MKRYILGLQESQWKFLSLVLLFACGGILLDQYFHWKESNVECLFVQDSIRYFATLTGKSHKPSVAPSDSAFHPNHPTRKTNRLLPGQKISINTAGEEELELIPGIGPVLARSIVNHRRSRGFFTHPNDLLEVKGIGPKKLEKILPYISLENNP